MRIEQPGGLVKLLVTRFGPKVRLARSAGRGDGRCRPAGATRSQMRANASTSAGPVISFNVVGAMPKKVLVVEDNELNMKLFNDLLEASGYQVIQTRDGLSALELARRHQPDLILMDIQLPEVSGIEVTKWLKEDDELRHIPVIAVTAFAMKGDEQKIREGGCEAYISKPISVVSFLQTIEGYLKKPA